MNDQVLPHPCTQQDFLRSVEIAIESFKDNLVFERLNVGKFAITDYQKLLAILFHQVRYSSSSFALAGSLCPIKYMPAKLYFFQHAEEEMNHWIWILDDLSSTDYSGPDPRSVFSHYTAEAYLSYAMFLAHTHPVSRLAMAMVLEGISGKYGSEYGKKLISGLGLSNKQASFFMQHGELDKGHSEEIGAVIKKLDLTGDDYAQMAHTATCTEKLYKNIYTAVFE